MKLAIMQPYFFPYIGYFQLIATVDVFVLYDNIKYTKKGWINRNRWLQNGVDSVFTLPLKNNSDMLDVRDREVHPNFDRVKFMNQLKGNYQKAPYFDEVYSLVRNILPNEDLNLFRVLHRSIKNICDYLGISTKIIISSAVDANHSLKGGERVLSICKACNASTYINPIGGIELYSKEVFKNESLELQFLKPRPIVYEQFGAPFLPSLSILDVMMFNSPSKLRGYLKEFDLI